MSEKTVEVQLLRSPLNWQLSTIYQLYQLFLFTKVYRKNWKNLKKLVDGLETNCYIYYVEIDCSISTRKIENFWKKWKNFNFYPWQNQNNFLYLIRQNKMPLSRRLAENWKNGSFWKLLVINRTYWLQDQSYAPVAQLVAQRTLNPWVEGSSPSWGTTTGCSSVWLERLIWDQEVVGSNPTSPILFKNSSNLKTIDFSLMRRAGNWLQVWLRHRRALHFIVI